MSISNNNKAQARLLLGLLSACRAANVKLWLLGGWGVDALCGVVTREHTDVDFIAELSSRPVLREVASAFADEVTEDTPEKLHLVRDGTDFDIVFYQRLPDGSLALDLDAADPCVYPTPPDSFPAEPNGSVLGTPCRAISWGAQYVARQGFCYFRDEPLRPRDEQDLAIIREYLSEAERAELAHYFPGIPRSRPGPHGV